MVHVASAVLTAALFFLGRKQKQKGKDGNSLAHGDSVIVKTVIDGEALNEAKQRQDHWLGDSRRHQEQAKHHKQEQFKKQQPLESNSQQSSELDLGPTRPHLVEPVIMPRSSRGSSSRSSSGPAPSAPGSSFGRRGASTVASPPPQQRAQPPAAQPQQHNTPSPVPQPAPSGGGGGFLSNVMGTAAGVGMGSVIGHGVSNALFGGSGSGHVQEAAPAPQEQQQSAFQQEQPTQCSIQAKDFTQCLTATNNDVTACQFYLDQLKACQQMASQY